MKIPGIGTLTKAEFLEPFNEVEKKRITEGRMPIEEAGRLYKVKKAKQISKRSDLSGAFGTYYRRIPVAVVDKINAEELAALIDSYGR